MDVQAWFGFAPINVAASFFSETIRYIYIYIYIFANVITIAFYLYRYRRIAFQLQESRCWYAALDRTMQNAEKKGPEESGMGLRPIH